jgi:hypothetical protein
MNLINDINKQLLWNVIQKKQLQISYDYFIEQFHYFYNSSPIDKMKNASKEELMDFNKKCLLHIVNAVKNQEIEKEPYTIEEIQNLRREKFTNELSKKQFEFFQYSEKPRPIIPITFNEETDKPIDKIEELISQTITKRELEFQQFQKYHPPPPLPKHPSTAAPKLLTIMERSADEYVVEPIELPFDSYTPIDSEKQFNVQKDKIFVLEEKLDLIIQLLQNKLN